MGRVVWVEVARALAAIALVRACVRRFREALRTQGSCRWQRRQRVRGAGAACVRLRLSPLLAIAQLVLAQLVLAQHRTDGFGQRRQGWRQPGEEC